MIDKNSETVYQDLLFTQESWEENGEQRADIWVEDQNGNSSSIACAVQQGVFSNNDTPLTPQQMETCVEVMDWAADNDLY